MTDNWLTETKVDTAPLDDMVRLRLIDMKRLPGRDGERKHLLKRIHAMFGKEFDNELKMHCLRCLINHRFIRSSNELFYSEALALVDRFYRITPDGVQFDEEAFQKAIEPYV